MIVITPPSPRLPRPPPRLHPLVAPALCPRQMFNVSRRSSADGRLRKLIEAAVFGWFVVESVMSEMRMVAAGGVRGTDHAAHFGGVFAGAVLILLARRSIRDNRYET
ncbi:unnamed protein product [Laminaria digitata]